MKMISKFGMSIAAIAGALIVGTTPMTAFAQTGPEAECICEDKCEDKVINEDCPVCAKDYTLCQGKELEVEETVSEDEVTEEPMGPLTPDGNLELVDDYGSIEAGGKQFITVVTKAGNYFYIIIDRDDNGTENVHFLNMVDESDLLKLMEDDEAKDYNESMTKDEEEIVTPTEEPSTEEVEVEQPEKKKKNPVSYLVIMFILGIGGAGGYLYMKKSKSKSTKKTAVDPDADYDEDEDYLSEMGIEEDVADDLETDENDMSDFVDEDDISEESEDEE